MANKKADTKFEAEDRFFNVIVGRGHDGDGDFINAIVSAPYHSVSIKFREGDLVEDADGKFSDIDLDQVKEKFETDLEELETMCTFASVLTNNKSKYVKKASAVMISCIAFKCVEDLGRSNDVTVIETK